MLKDPTHVPSRQDYILLRHVLLKLTATSKLVATAIVVIVALIWYDLFNRMLAFGAGIDYADNHVLGSDATAFIQRYNPYFWWAVVLICTILIAYIVYQIVRALLRRARSKPVDAASFDALSEQLSLPALDVLMWAWQPRDEPLTVGDLQLARAELGAGRAAKLQRAAQQFSALEQARQQR